MSQVFDKNIREEHTWDKSEHSYHQPEALIEATFELYLTKSGRGEDWFDIDLTIGNRWGSHETVCFSSLKDFDEFVAYVQACQAKIHEVHSEFEQAKATLPSENS